MTEVGDGFYSYDFTTYDEELDYSIRCDGSSSITNDAERYTYAGNESYMEDILDASINDHDSIGSVGASILGAMGSVVLPPGHGHGNGLSKEQLELIAKEVWSFMLNNDKRAQDVLITRSDFNAIRDKVLLDENNLPAVLSDVSKFESLKVSVDKVMDKMCEMKMTVDVPEALTKSISNSVAQTSELIKSVKKIVPAVEGVADILDATVDEFSDKITELDLRLAGTNLDLSKAKELAEALTLIKDSLMGMVALSSATNSVEARRHNEMLKKSMIGLTNLKFMALK